MPVRSNGRLLAGTGAVLALCLTGPGCQTRQVVPTAMAPAPSGVVTVSAPVATAPQPQTIATTSPPPARRFSFFRRSRPAVEVQAPVTETADARAQGMAVIASTWQPVTRVASPAGATANPPTPEVRPPAGPAVAPAGMPAVAPPGSLQQTSIRLPDGQSNDTPWRPVVASAQAGPVMLPEAAPVPHNVALPTLPETTPAPRLVPQPVPPPHGAVTYHYPSGIHAPVPAPVIPPVPREFEKQSLPPYVVAPPDILLINASNAITLPTQQLRGQHLVRPDGTISLGIYGSVYVAGLTLEQIRDVVASVLKMRQPKRLDENGKPTGEELTLDQIRSELVVDVLAYNSKVYYVVTDGGGYGEQVYRLSATGNETVLDALSQINGLPPVASKKKIWVARATPDHSAPMILPVDWCGIVRDGSAATNYQIFPGDRIYVNSDPLIRTDSFLSKFLSPIDRVFGTMLLGSTTVNSIRTGGSSTGTGGGVP